ncbi:unnamed protein product [Bursaphelenchus okinawaensis]|uniref:Uncharacterized protein n=1 Tax=Bursaphelenchus okinawaensis TaxID=465554 RepID=A0A811KEQ5_9BILA|nr:unnamed protein product [Bursaphelenchus okinawaensis]CAG9101858.1 unnamed protein product [Bursaphelenchus okinawaensis]
MLSFTSYFTAFLLLTTASSDLLEKFAPNRYYVTVEINAICERDLSTTISLHDEDQFFDDDLAIVHVTDGKPVTLDGFEKEYGTFQPYIRLIGTCNGKPHMLRHLIPKEFIYNAKVMGHPIYEVEVDLDKANNVATDSKTYS